MKNISPIKVLLSGFCLLLCFCASAATNTVRVEFPLISMFGGNLYTKSFRVEAAAPVITDGTNTWVGTYTTVTPAGGTNPVALLTPNDYLVTFTDARTPWRIRVPNTTNQLSATTQTIGPMPTFLLTVGGSSENFDTNTPVIMAGGATLGTDGTVTASLIGTSTGIALDGANMFRIADIDIYAKGGYLELTNFNIGVRAQSFIGAGSNLTGLKASALTSNGIAGADLGKVLTFKADGTLGASNASGGLTLAQANAANNSGTNSFNLIAGTNAQRTVASLRSARTQKPILGQFMYYSGYNGTNFLAGSLNTNALVSPGIPMLGNTNSFSFQRSGKWDGNIYGDVTEFFVLAMATNYVNLGLAAMGYDVIDITDGWAASAYTNQARSASGVLNPDPVKFPRGMKYVFDTLHKMGLRGSLWTTLTDTTSVGQLGSGGTNTVTDANTYTYWGVDIIRWDWDHSDNAAVPLDTDEKKRLKAEEFISALQATNSNAYLFMHVNIGTYNGGWAKYSPWMLDVVNAIQLTDPQAGSNPDSSGWDNTVHWWEVAARTSAQMGPYRTPAAIPIQDGFFNSAAANFGGNNGKLFMAQQAMFHSPLVFGGSGGNFISSGTINSLAIQDYQTNGYMIAINQDDLCAPPVKTITNGMIDVWVGRLASNPLWAPNTKSMCIFNRAYVTNSFPATNITISLSAFGVATNDYAVFFDIWNRTNYFATNTVYFSVPTNSTSWWLVSRGADRAAVISGFSNISSNGQPQWITTSNGSIFSVASTVGLATLPTVVSSNVSWIATSASSITVSNVAGNGNFVLAGYTHVESGPVAGSASYGGTPMNRIVSTNLSATFDAMDLFYLAGAPGVTNIVFTNNGAAGNFGEAAVVLVLTNAGSVGAYVAQLNSSAKQFMTNTVSPTLATDLVVSYVGSDATAGGWYPASGGTRTIFSLNSGKAGALMFPHAGTAGTMSEVATNNAGAEIAGMITVVIHGRSGLIPALGNAEIFAATNTPVNGYALRYTNGNFYWAP